MADDSRNGARQSKATGRLVVLPPNGAVLRSQVVKELPRILAALVEIARHPAESLERDCTEIEDVAAIAAGES